MRVAFDFSQSAPGQYEGSFTALAERAMLYPFDTVRVHANNVHIELGGGSTVFVGTLSGDTFAGTFSDEGAKGRFTLRRVMPEPLPYGVQNVRFRNRNVVLAGTLCIPPGGGKHPGIVFVQGSGPESRWGQARFLADFFARRGIAALAYDKRGVGESGGDWKTAGFGELAGDALAAVHFLQAQANVNPKHVGIYGHSQGGIVSPLAAAQSRDVAFVVAASTWGGAIYEQDAYSIRNQMRAQHLSDADISQAMRYFSMWVHALHDSRKYARLKSDARTVGATRWFRFLGLPMRDSARWRFFEKTEEYNTLTAWRNVHVPVLLLFGAQDETVEARPSIARIQGALQRAGNRFYRTKLYPDADHTLRVRAKPNAPFSWPQNPQGFPSILTDWVLKLRAESSAHRHCTALSAK